MLNSFLSIIIICRDVNMNIALLLDMRSICLRNRMNEGLYGDRNSGAVIILFIL